MAPVVAAMTMMVRVMAVFFVFKAVANPVTGAGTVVVISAASGVVMPWSRLTHIASNTNTYRAPHSSADHRAVFTTHTVA